MSPTQRSLAILFVLAIAPVQSGCSSAPTAGATASATEGWQSEFAVDKTDLASSGTNPWFVLVPGHELVLEGREGRKNVRLVVRVLDETEMVDGVETRVVEERETEDGEPVEVSRNYFAISKSTNDVYYFGEDVDIYEDGKVVKHAGAWRSGVNGARFGLALPGVPEVGRKYQQEMAPGIALDRFEITSVHAPFETPAGRFADCLRIDETTPLEPGDKEHKHYARGIGLVQDGNLLLVSYGMQPKIR